MPRWRGPKVPDAVAQRGLDKQVAFAVVGEGVVLGACAGPPAPCADDQDSALRKKLDERVR